jgi:hypothetical protein
MPVPATKARWLAALAVLLLAGCTPSPPAAAPTYAATPGPTPAVDRPAATSDVAVLDCGAVAMAFPDHVVPDGVPAAGPVSFAPFDFGFGQPDAREPDAQGWRWYKTPLVIEKGARATLTIPRGYRDVAKLTYAGSGHATTFVACTASPESHFGFAGGFAVREPVCLPVEVGWDGGSQRLMLGLGKAGC